MEILIIRRLLLCDTLSILDISINGARYYIDIVFIPIKLSLGQYKWEMTNEMKHIVNTSYLSYKTHLITNHSEENTEHYDLEAP